MDDHHHQPRQLGIDEAIAAAELGIDEQIRELVARLVSIAPEMLSLSAYRWTQACEATAHVERVRLRAPDRKCAQSDEALATDIGWTLAQWREALRTAKIVGTVTARRSYASGVRGPDLLAVAHARIDQLASLARESIQVETTRSKSIHLDSSRSKSIQLGAQDARAPRALRNPPSGDFEALLSSSSPTPESPSNAVERPALDGAHGARSEWEQAVGEVFQAGVNAATAAVDRVRREGGTPATVQALVAWWRPRASAGAWDYPEAVLYRRLCRWKPGQAIDADWPQPKPGWRDPAEAQRAASLAAERRRADEREREARDAAARAENARLEAAHGAALDALTDDERRELIADNAVLVRYLRDGDKCGAARLTMLRRLAARATPAAGGAP